MSLGSKFIVILMGLLISVSGQNCSNPPARREWRQLSEGQRQAYIVSFYFDTDTIFLSRQLLGL